MNKLTEIKVSYKTSMSVGEKTKIKSSKCIYSFLINNWNKDLIELQEHFYLILLNQSNHIIGYKCIFSGGMSSTIVDIKLIYSIALKCCASSIVIAHNHPSGGLSPSVNDIRLTNKIKEAGKLLDIDLLDHLIVTKYGYYSLADEGRL